MLSEILPAQRGTAMKTIKNKAHQSLRVPLPQGKILHLGPNQTGQVADLDHPPLQKLIEAGELEVIDDGGRGRGGGPGAGGEAVHSSPHGHVPTKVVHPSGDR
jgi:hypothetical protein